MVEHMGTQKEVREKKSNLYARRNAITCFLGKNVTFLWLYFYIKIHYFSIEAKSHQFNLYVKMSGSVDFLFAHTFTL